jgi:hypothetical protein
MTDEELIKVLYEHCDRLIASMDGTDEPFHSIEAIYSAERKDGGERKIILRR